MQDAGAFLTVIVFLSINLGLSPDESGDHVPCQSGQSLKRQQDLVSKWDLNRVSGNGQREYLRQFPKFMDVPGAQVVRLTQRTIQIGTFRRIGQPVGFRSEVGGRR